MTLVSAVYVQTATAPPELELELPELLELLELLVPPELLPEDVELLPVPAAPPPPQALSPASTAAPIINDLPDPMRCETQDAHSGSGAQ